MLKKRGSGGAGFYSKMLAMALPIAMQNMLSSCSGLLTTAMVAGLGNLQVAAVGVAERWTFLLNLIFFGVASGSSVLISQYWGAGDRENVRRAHGLGLVLGLGVAALFSVACIAAPQALISVFSNERNVIIEGARYLRIAALGMIPHAYGFIISIARRATEDVKITVVAALLTVCVNLCGNYILIYGHFGAPALGIRGGAISSAVSMFVYAAFYLIMGARQRHFTFMPVREMFKVEREFVMRYIKIAAPVLANETMWGMAVNIYVAIFARQGSENYAGYTIFYSIQELTFVFFAGVCAACAIMVGKAVGAGDTEGAYGLGRRFMILTPLMGAVIGVGLILARGPILGLMNIETEYARSMASNLLLFASFWMGIRNISYIGVVGIFRAGGDTKTGLYLEIAAMYMLAIPAVAVVAYLVKAPFLLIVISMYLAEDIPKSAFCVYYFRSRRWIRRLTIAGGEGSRPES